MPQYELIWLFQPGCAICGHMDSWMLFRFGAAWTLVEGACTITGGLALAALAVDTLRLAKGTTAIVPTDAPALPVPGCSAHAPLTPLLAIGVLALGVPPFTFSTA